MVAASPTEPWARFQIDTFSGPVRNPDMLLRGYNERVITILFEALLGVIGLALIAFGVYGVIRDKYSTQTSGGALGGQITLPLSGLLLILGLVSLGFAAYLQATGTGTPTAGPVAQTPSAQAPSANTTSPTQSISPQAPTETAASPAASIAISPSR